MVRKVINFCLAVDQTFKESTDFLNFEDDAFSGDFMTIFLWKDHFAFSNPPISTCPDWLGG